MYDFLLLKYDFLLLSNFIIYPLKSFESVHERKCFTCSQKPRRRCLFAELPSAWKCNELRSRLIDIPILSKRSQSRKRRNKIVNLSSCLVIMGPLDYPAGHMVRNKLCWDENNVVGLPKQMNSYRSSPTFLWFGSSNVLFASKHNLFSTR